MKQSTEYTELSAIHLIHYSQHHQTQMCVSCLWANPPPHLLGSKENIKARKTYATLLVMLPSNPCNKFQMKSPGIAVKGLLRRCFDVLEGYNGTLQLSSKTATTTILTSMEHKTVQLVCFICLFNLTSAV